MRVLDGIQFFDSEQQFLKLYEFEQVHEQDKKLTASSLVTYLLMRSLCDDAGLIQEADLNLKAVCKKMDLPYSSIHNGYHRLFDIGLLTIARIGERTYIKLPIVAAHMPDAEDNEISSYFRIPKSIFSSNLLRDFIKSRDVRGLLGLLDIVNGLFREWARKRSTTLKRKKDTLISKLKQSKYAFRKWLKHVLHGKNSLIEIKNEYDEMYELKFSETAFTERKRDEVYEQFNAAVRNTLSSLLRSSSIQFKTNELNDLQYACQQELTSPLYRAILENENAENLVKMVVTDVLDTTVSEVERNASKVKVLGAYFRKTLRIQTRIALKDEKPLRILIASTYRNENLVVPEQFL
ncbi:hypothetical protein ACMGD3_23910 [Lysinibacillus sphaericus]|uniref:hypothetical protein n=1 Tax=Lysinibacillus sphaericus TaxID=1421 RepID=UPI003F7A0F64